MLWRSAGLVFALMMLSGCCVQRCGMTGDIASTSGDGACGSCDTCGSPCDGLLSPLRDMMCCGSGCGEFYYDEWLSDPPQCCDPCDNCGNWIGPADCCRWHNYPLNWCNLWGVRHQCHAPAATEVWNDGEVVVDEQWSDEMVAPEAPSGDEEMQPKGAEPPQPKKSAQPQKSALKKRAMAR